MSSRFTRTDVLPRWLCGLGLALLTSGPAQAQSIESVLSPGPVIEGHVKTEHECKACHTRFDRNAQDGLCIACHKEVGQDVRAGTGWHGKRDQKQQPCRACHTDHKGRGFKAAAFDQKSFDHKLTDFELLDKHAKVDCAKCHVAGKRWREAALSCDGCHRKDDVHKGSLGAKCEDCHSARDWKTTRFDHDKTRFALTGKHIDAKCDACHVDQRYKDTPRTCIGCHRKEDDDKGHKGQYGEKCETCHGTKAWKPSQFNHDTDTRYLLKDKHRQVKCSACHTTPLYAKKTGKTCIDCHQKDDKHKDTLGRDCAKCHTERGWKEPAGFDHQKTKFPLRGKHVDTPCKQCHEDNAHFKGAPTRCIDCHKKDDKHGGTLGDKCESCHGEQNWKTLLPGSFDHDKTKFPLRNAHASRTVKCTDCHESPRHFKNTPTACFSCHKRDDRHEATLGEKCEQCHGDLNWRVPRFDHAKTRYPLVGGHLVVACKACHQSLRYREAPRDCYGCHRKDDRHKAALGPQCENCHNVRAWTLWDFDHDRGTRFRLEGKHRRITCEACHTQPAPPGRKAAPVGSDCMACHRKDDVHEGNFGRRCEQCHDNENWKRLKRGTRP